MSSMVKYSVKLHIYAEVVTNGIFPVDSSRINSQDV